MGLFSAPNPFDGLVEKVTDAKNTAEDWGLIMDLCDQVQSHRNGAKDCLRAIIKRLNNQDPHVVLQAITVLDACVNNCNKEFRLEVASREFENEFRRLLGRTQPKIQEKLRGLLKTWAEGEFKGDSQLSLIPSLYQALKKEGVDFSSASDTPKKSKSLPKDPNVVSSQQEEDDIAKAIQLSLQESKGHTSKVASSSSSSSSSLYPSNSLYGAGAASATSAVTSSSSSKSNSSPKKEEKKARALYDFEAAEDNEITFKSGEIVIILDDSDANWWKGSNHRGEGLFPSNFVTTDLNAEPEEPSKELQRRRSVQFNEEVEVVNANNIIDVPVNEISEDKIDQVLQLLHEADPTQPESDAPELPSLEDQVHQMGPLIDAELESVDRRHAQLTRLSTELVDALNLYHQLMHENVGQYPPMSMAPGIAYGAPPYSTNPLPPQGFNGYFQAGPPGAPGMPTGPPPPMHHGYQQPQMQSDHNPLYAGSAPPPPTPPLDTKNQQVNPQPHFPTSQPSAAPFPGMNGGQYGMPPVSGYMPQM